MSKYLFLFVTIVVLVACGDNAQKQESEAQEEKELLSTDLVNVPHTAKGVDTVAMNELPTMDFADTVYDFGIMSAGEQAVHDFEFTNNGNTPLIIAHAKGSCGCTVADYPSKPTEPGGKAVIKVMFDSEGKTGYQEKSVVITTNTAKNLHTLSIKAEVKE